MLDLPRPRAKRSRVAATSFACGTSDAVRAHPQQNDKITRTVELRMSNGRMNQKHTLRTIQREALPMESRPFQDCALAFTETDAVEDNGNDRGDLDVDLEITPDMAARRVSP